MRNSKSNRTSNKVRTARPSRVPERNCTTDGVYGNNYFMHAATCHVGNLVKIETVQGSLYEGVFKTFSDKFEVVLELAHKVEHSDPQKVNPSEVVDTLIFNAQDIVYMCAPNTEPNYALKGAFQIDSNISKFNGEIVGEKELQPWEGPPICNGEECDLEASANTQNGWNVHDMFLANEQFGVQTTYDDSLSDYTCQIHRKDTKDFREDEAKAARIAMEIERNPSSQARSALENGDNEEEMYAAVQRGSATESDDKYVPPPMKRKSSQHHRASGGGSGVGGGGGGGGGSSSCSGAGNRANYSTNGNQRSYNVPESPGRQQMNNAAAVPRYHHQTSQQYHQQQQPGGSHSQPMRDTSNRSSPENKNNAQMVATNANQPQNIPTYPPTNIHQQQRSYPPNVVSIPNHAQNIAIQSSKSQRTSPIAVSALSNGNSDYSTKQLPTTSQPIPHQYHGQNQQSQNNAATSSNTQRKHHHQQQHHHVIGKGGREELNSELKKFSNEFNLSSSYDCKNREHDAPKPIQVVTSRNKSPPITQPPSERNVVTISLVSTQSQPNKYSTATASSQPASVVQSAQTTPHPSSQQQQTPLSAVPQSPTAGGQPVSAVTQAALKQHPSVLPQQQPPPFQPMHLQPRGGEPPSVLIQHQPHLAQQPPHLASHQPILQAKSQPSKPVPHQLAIHHSASAPPILTQVTAQTPSAVQLPPHSAVSSASVQPKTVINTQTVASSTVPPQTTQPTSPPQIITTQQQVCILPPNVHQRPPLQQQPSLQKSTASQSSQSAPQSPPTPHEAGSLDAEVSTVKSKDDEDVIDDVTSTLKKSTLNPEAKEFVYNPAPKSFTPVSRSPSTPTQSRPHTPQTPSNYNIHAANAPVAAAAGIQMVMPTYVVAASPGYVPSPPASSRIRKVPVNSHRTPEFHPSNIPVSAVTGQPLLAPSVTLAPSPLGHGTSFPVPAYPHHPQLAAQHYPHVQMIRMVQQGGMVPLVPSTISYHDSTGSNATAVYVNHQSGAVTMAPHSPHIHHPQQHPPPSTAPSPSQTPQGPSQSHTPNSYQHPPLATQSAPPYQSIMCPVIQAPPSHAPPHHMVAAAQAQPHTMQQYLQHQQQVAQQSHIQVSLIPHSCS